jgi:mRNA interferase MazF
MKKSDIILTPFPFTDLSGNKTRPALVLIDSKDEVTVCFLTTQLKWMSDFDIVIEPSEANGLKKKSLIRLNKFATLDKDLILGRLGSLENDYISKLNTNLISILKLHDK